MALLGATVIVDHTGVTAAVVRARTRTASTPWLHFAGDLSAVEPALRAGGRFVLTLMSPDQVSTETVIVVPVFANPTPDGAGASWPAPRPAARPSFACSRCYPLAEVADAFGRPSSRAPSASSSSPPTDDPATRRSDDRARGPRTTPRPVRSRCARRPLRFSASTDRLFYGQVDWGALSQRHGRRLHPTPRTEIALRFATPPADTHAPLVGNEGGRALSV